MRCEVSLASVVGKTTPGYWAKTIRGPGWYAVIETSGASDEEARSLGVAVVDGIKRAFALGVDLPQSPVRELSALVRPGVRSLCVLYGKGTDIQLIIYGGGAAYLKRHDRFATLLTGPGAISGRITKGDLLVLQSVSCAAALSIPGAFGIFDHLPVQDIARKLTVRLDQSTEHTAGNALIIEVSGVIADEPVPEAAPVTAQERETIRNVIGRQPSWTVRVRHFMRPRARIASLERRVHALWRRFRSVDTRVTAAIAVVFLVSVGLGIRREAMLKTDKQTQQHISAAEKSYDEGMALMSLNPVKARDRLSAAKASIDAAAAKVKPTTKDGRKVAELVKKIDDAYKLAKREFDADPQLFFDVGLLKTGSKANDVALYDETIALSDAATRTVYAVSVATKNGQIIGGGDGFDGPGLTALHGDDVFYLTSAGVNRISIRDKKAKKNVIAKTEDWGTIGSMIAFAGNLYLLDTSKGRIWKYVASETGFSTIKEYLNADVMEDLSASTGMVIDGSVWIGRTDGRVAKFTQGREDTFQPQGIEPAITGPVSAYASDETEKLYLLDSYGKRVIVLDKDGIYAGQYRWKSPLMPTKIVVAEKSGKIFLLGDGKLYSIDIRQL